MTKKLINLIILLTISIGAFSQQFNILDYGAKAQTGKINTTSIQKAIDACSLNGGGTVVVPTGTFVTGMIQLKSHVNLNLSNGAILQALANAEYESLVLLDGVEDASVTGCGTLFGNGEEFVIEESAPGRPYIIWARNSKNVRIHDVNLYNSACWALKLTANDGVVVHGVKIYSHANFNNDGIDIDSKNVVVSDCIIDTGDDALCLKSETPNTICENVVVTNCILRSNCNFIKMGTGSIGGFKNIAISNCSLHKASESKLHQWNVASKQSIPDSITGISGIALEIVDGGIMDQVTISNITMTGVQTPIFIRLGTRKNPTGVLKNVLISNVVASSHSKIASSITGVPGFYVENVVLRDILINNQLGASAPVTRLIPESEKSYPENRMFGWDLPAFGFYIRHAKNIILDNVRINPVKDEVRPAFWLEDAHDVQIRNAQIEKGQVVEKACTKVEIGLN